MTSNVDELEFIMREIRKPRCGKRTHCGGVMPICIDPDTRITYALLGKEFARTNEDDPYIDAQGHLNKRVVLCTFHGWVEPGETVKKGAAREAAEESRGVFATQLDILRCLVLPDFHKKLTNGVFIISLGEMTSEERDNLCTRFRSTIGASLCENEMIDIHFVVMRELRSACLQQRHDYRLGSDRWPVSSFPPQVWLRKFLQHWLTQRTNWYSPWIENLCIGVTDSTSIIRSIYELPDLNILEAAEYDFFMKNS
jgi:hypothetical protein